MDRPATARDIIQEILRNMREGLEPLHYTTLPPAIYHVYLHPTDMERLRGILPRITEEAKRALDAELEAFRKPSLAEKLKLSRSSAPPVAAPDGGWQIRILENTDDDVSPGDIVIHSELAMPAKEEFGAGSMTKRISTRRLSGEETATHNYAPPSPAPAAPTAISTGAQPAMAVETGVWATIEYQDASGRKTYRMTKDQIVVGRGGRDYWTDVKLETLPDVSREHFRLRRDPNTGEFFLKDLSRLGTTINGEKAPSSVDFADGEKRDRNVEAPVPAEARIGLADVLYLDFKSTPKT